MRKDIKKRLEKALITLEEPGGSTIQAIVEIINKDSPVLSVRKVLEALQDGINEGFLCMYNGRFKLKQQIQREGENKERYDHRKGDSKERKGSGKPLPPETDPKNEESDYMSEEDDDDDDDEDEDYDEKPKSKKSAGKRLPSFQTLNKCHKHPSKKMFTRRRKQSRRLSKKAHMKKGQQEAKKMRLGKDSAKLEQSVLEMTSNEPEKSSRPAAERIDLKKQRGPRCTSMKKDIRMPSKVQIPCVPASVPPRSNTFNDLLRRSPEPVTGPLFDYVPITANNSGFFGAYY